MPQKERLRVWRGELKKTSGGLTKNDLVKNHRGKIVSKKKSSSSSKENNLGRWLRVKGEAFGAKLKDAGKPLPRLKGQGKAKPNKQAPKPKPAKKQAPKKQAPKKQAPKQKNAKNAKNAPKKRARSPVKAGQLKSSKISVGNILVKKKAPKVPANWPKWTGKVLGIHANAEKELKEMVEEYEDDGEKIEWEVIRKVMKSEFYLSV